jgi:5-formyltetrahydrofolate cyclo-ligase
MESKDDIRTKVKKLIEKMTVSEKKEESGKITQKLIAFLQEKEFQALITYLPFADEVDITAVTNYFREE